MILSIRSFHCPDRLCPFGLKIKWIYCIRTCTKNLRCRLQAFPLLFSPIRSMPPQLIWNGEHGLDFFGRDSFLVRSSCLRQLEENRYFSVGCLHDDKKRTIILVFGMHPSHRSRSGLGLVAVTIIYRYSLSSLFLSILLFIFRKFFPKLSAECLLSTFRLDNPAPLSKKQ